MPYLVGALVGIILHLHEENRKRAILLARMKLRDELLTGVVVGLVDELDGLTGPVQEELSLGNGEGEPDAVSKGD